MDDVSMKERVISVLENIGIGGSEPFKYTGRGMKKACVAFQTDLTMPKLLSLMIEIGHFAAKNDDPDDEEEVHIMSVLGHVEVDSLGHNTVVYFPDAEWTEE